MLFNSINFVLFLPFVFLMFWFLSNGKIKIQNYILLISSYYFYSCWDVRFLILLIFSTFIDYISGIKISRVFGQRKKIWFYISIIINIGFLGFFKYYNFFIESFQETLHQLGVNFNPWTLKIILPVGISFYTFHGLSYVIDIYKGRIKPEYNFINYSVFVSFFPLLVAGPIERASHLLPQIKKIKVFDYSMAYVGLKQILWGLFKKVVIADQCSEYANLIFTNYSDYSGSTLYIGAMFFTFQIYGDFSGYSDIALGSAKLFGINLLKNFSFPYFSRDIPEFWRRWHISLSSWFRDYLYIPLGGSKVNILKKIRNIFIIFIVSGFWHGANWTFIFWGALNAFFMLPYILFNSNRTNIKIVALGKNTPSFREVFSILFTFNLIICLWIFFRAYNLNHAFQILSIIFSPTFFTLPTVLPIELFLLIIIFIFIEWLGRESDFAIEKIDYNVFKIFKWMFYYLIVFMVIYYSGSEQKFIYFQF
jgi:alginate O-acetyltransferase complex protein AlgI